MLILEIPESVIIWGLCRSLVICFPPRLVFPPLVRCMAFSFRYLFLDDWITSDIISLYLQNVKIIYTFHVTPL